MLANEGVSGHRGGTRGRGGYALVQRHREDEKPLCILHILSEIGHILCGCQKLRGCARTGHRGTRGGDTGQDTGITPSIVVQTISFSVFVSFFS